MDESSNPVTNCYVGHSLDLGDHAGKVASEAGSNGRDEVAVLPVCDAPRVS